MKLKELLDNFKSYSEKYPECLDYDVLLCDDGIQPEFFNIDSTLIVSYSKLVKPSINKSLIQIQPPQYSNTKVMALMFNKYGSINGE